jgi:hypothetical protein
MSESTKPESNADDLTKTTEDGSVNLTEDELGGVSGGLIHKVEDAKF